MTIGESRITNMVLRMLGQEARMAIDDYLNMIMSRDFMVMTSISQVKNLFGEAVDLFLSNTTESELMDLRSYTGYNYKNINALLRNNWKYEVNGVFDQDKSNELNALSYSLSQILNKFVMPKIDFVTFRGATLTSFSSYGVSNIQQLKSLEGKFLYEQGFTSTSILKDSSYINKDLGNGKKYNVGVRYLIPSESNDGALLITDEMSYSTNQNEFLLDKGSLCKVIDVKIDENTDSAIITVILIPKKVYDLNYDRNRSGSKNI